METNIVIKAIAIIAIVVIGLYIINIYLEPPSTSSSSIKQSSSQASQQSSSQPAQQLSSQASQLNPDISSPEHCGLWSNEGYFEVNTDLPRDIDPLLHYIQRGYHEKRPVKISTGAIGVFDDKAYLSIHDDVSPNTMAFEDFRIRNPYKRTICIKCFKY
jgi:hypothetical protein